MELFLEALATLGPDDMSEDGKPKMRPLNDALKALGGDKITADDRDALLAQIETEDGVEGDVTICLTDASESPITITINGRHCLTMRVGETRTVPPEALNALDYSGYTY